MKKTNEKMVKGYKGFSPGMICRGKQYAENTVFKEKKAKMCEKGMHFCKHPLAVLPHYRPVQDGKISEYAEVEVPCGYAYTDDSIKYCTNELHIKNKLSLEELCQAAINLVYAHIKPVKEENKDATLGKENMDHTRISADDGRIATLNTGMWSVAANKGVRSIAINTGGYSIATNDGENSVAVATMHYSVSTNIGHYSIAINTGCYSIATNNGALSVAVNTGNQSIATNADWGSVAINTGRQSVAMNSGIFSVAITTGDDSAAIVNSEESIAIALGSKSMVKGALGSWIVCAEWESPDGVCCHIANLKAAFVDGEKIKPDTYYRLKNGKFIEVKDA